MDNELPDLELVARCISGSDETAWEQFLRRFGRLVWSTIHRTFRAACHSYSQEDAEDLFSAVLLSLVEKDFRALRQFEARNACSLATWLTVVSSRKTMDHMRRNRPYQSLEDLPEAVRDGLSDGRDSVDHLMMEQQRSGALDRTVGMLSADDRKVYDLLFRKGLSPESAAASLETTPAAVYTRKHRLIGRMKKLLEDL
jgi:RNA polymerase sigma factor (sigma-70 family)